MTPRWYERPAGHTVVLTHVPRPASWNATSDPAQQRVAAYVEDTARLVAPHVPDEPWSLWLDVGLAPDRELVTAADLDNYALPLASRLRTERTVSVWCTKAHGATSSVHIAPAVPAAPPERVTELAIRAPAESRAYKEAVRDGVAGLGVLADGAVRLELAFVVGPARNWLNLWKPTIDALGPLLGKGARAWAPQDGRIIELGLHVAVDETAGHEVVVAVSASSA